jgi:YgiT-type zinc finger domain-containing protein
MKCVICRRGDTEPGRTTMSFQSGESTVIVKNVPADICRICGEPYMSTEVALVIENLVNDAVRKGAEVEILRYAA